MKKAGCILLIATTLMFTVFISGLFLKRNYAGGTVESYALAENEVKSNRMQEWRININTATKDELTLLPGIGPALAQRILDYREENGPFTSTAQLIQVNGIGQATLEGLRDYIVLEDIT